VVEARGQAGFDQAAPHGLGGADGGGVDEARAALFRELVAKGGVFLDFAFDGANAEQDVGAVARDADDARRSQG
jgi:hypothetical protein